MVKMRLSYKWIVYVSVFFLLFISMKQRLRNWQDKVFPPPRGLIIRPAKNYNEIELNRGRRVLESMGFRVDEAVATVTDVGESTLVSIVSSGDYKRYGVSVVVSGSPNSFVVSGSDESGPSLTASGNALRELVESARTSNRWVVAVGSAIYSTVFVSGIENATVVVPDDKSKADKLTRLASTRKNVVVESSLLHVDDTTHLITVRSHAALDGLSNPELPTFKAFVDASTTRSSQAAMLNWLVSIVSALLIELLGALLYEVLRDHSRLGGVFDRLWAWWWPGYVAKQISVSAKSNAVGNEDSGISNKTSNSDNGLEDDNG